MSLHYSPAPSNITTLAELLDREDHRLVCARRRFAKGSLFYTFAATQESLEEFLHQPRVVNITKDFGAAIIITFDVRGISSLDDLAAICASAALAKGGETACVAVRTKGAVIGGFVTVHQTLIDRLDAYVIKGIQAAATLN